MAERRRGRTDGRDPGDVEESLIEDAAEAVGLLDRVRGNRTGRLLLKIGVGTLGVAIIGLGIVLSPLPGPGGAPIILLGLAVLALEFVWAKRVLHWARDQFRRWTSWVRQQNGGTRFLIGLGLLAFALLGLYASLRFSLGIDLLAEARAWLRTA